MRYRPFGPNMDIMLNSERHGAQGMSGRAMTPLHLRDDGSFVVLLEELPYHVTRDDVLWPEAAALDWSRATPEPAPIDPNSTVGVISVEKLDAAVEQLEWAIRLTVDYGAYLPAITLAGAAEEVFGKQSGSPLISELAQLASPQQPNLLAKKLASSMNDVRNWLKHNDRESSISSKCFNPENAALLMIHRALFNHMRCGLPQLQNAKRYYVWVARRSYSLKGG
jgi:hypothetical protein